MSTILDSVRSAEDVKRLAAADLPALAAEVRREMIAAVSKTGGHLASSLGAVETAICLLRVFDPEKDRIVWDVGHQTYAWKLLTGRRGAFGTIRQSGGLSGFCNPEESAADAFVSGHAGNALSVAEGMAAAHGIAGGEGHVVAVVGDASLSNGMSLEALNNCASLKSKVILVVNDNAMSISANVGSIARILGRLISGVRYNRIKSAAENVGHRMRFTFLRNAYHRVEQAVKSIWLDNAFFESFGLRYIGPVDGHDMRAVENALRVARDDKRSVAVHLVTVKGRGFAPAEKDPTAWHGVGPFELKDGGADGALPESGGGSWSDVFGETVAEIARKDRRVCALTAAMRDGTGLATFAKEFPDRFFDCGICEEHLVAFAAGLAKSGMRPVVAVYSSFLQRAFDQIMHDVCILGLPVVFAVDRAGCVGRDGRTHHGMFDIPMLKCLPNMAICAPKDAEGLRGAIEWSLRRGGPAAIRYPRGKCPERQAAAENAKAKIQIWALGAQVAKANRAAEILAERGIEAGVVHAAFAKPADEELLRAQRAAGAAIVSMEDGAVSGGFGESIGADLRFGWPDRFVSHGSVEELEKAHCFDAASVAASIAEKLQGRTSLIQSCRTETGKEHLQTCSGRS